MAYDEQLAERVRAVLGDRARVEEKRMFGGLAFMVDGYMACGLLGDALMVRLGAEGADTALDEPNVRAMDFTGRPMTSMVLVDPPGLASERELASWVARGVAFVETLPPRP